MAEHKARHPIGQRRLADALRAADQPGVRNPPAAIGVQQRRLGLAMAGKRAGLARMRHADLRFDLTGAHAELAALAGAASRRSRKAPPPLAAPGAGTRVASINTPRRGPRGPTSR